MEEAELLKLLAEYAVALRQQCALQVRLTLSRDTMSIALAALIILVLAATLPLYAARHGLLAVGPLAGCLVFFARGTSPRRLGLVPRTGLPELLAGLVDQARQLPGGNPVRDVRVADAEAALAWYAALNTRFWQ